MEWYGDDYSCKVHGDEFYQSKYKEKTENKMNILLENISKVNNELSELFNKAYIDSIMDKIFDELWSHFEFEIKVWSENVATTKENRDAFDAIFKLKEEIRKEIKKNIDK